MIRVCHDIICETEDMNSEKTAAFYKDDTISYHNIYDLSKRLAALLCELDIHRGDRVCVCLDKCFEKIISFFGISFSGAIFVPIHYKSTSRQIIHIIEDSTASVLITRYSQLEKLSFQDKHLLDLKSVIVIGEKEEIIIQNKQLKIYDWYNVINHIPSNYSLPRIIGTDLAAILYTSGSTGKPKGVVLNHHNLVEGVKRVSEYLNINEYDRLLSILSFGFDYGLNQLLAAFYKKAQLVLFNMIFPKHIIKISHKMQVTGIAAVAATWIQLLQTQWNQDDLPNLRYITNSGGAIPEKHVLELTKRLPNTSIYLMYGLTEAFRSTYLNPELVNKHPTSIGKAIPGEEVIIVNELNEPVKPGQTGELVHRGALVAQGYWNAPELTKERFRPDPFLPKDHPLPPKVVYSGDLVRIDEQGLLYFIGRKDEMIKCAGNRISPSEVEEIVYSSHLVEFVLAFGKPHEIFGHCVIIIVVPKNIDNFNLEQFKIYCRQNMPSYMVPEEIVVCNSLPINKNGKLDRAKIKAELV